MNKKPLIAPSFLSADFSHLADEISMINHSEADFLHLDIMDGMFVPNISFGFTIIKTISKLAEKPLDVHLMIEKPERYVTAFHEAGADMLTVHYEASIHLHRIIYQIKNENMLAGVALNPHTPVALIKDIITDLDLVLVMSVNPGFGGQHFINQSITKIKELQELIAANYSNCLIEVDGGIDIENAPLVVAAGADILVAGNAIFNSVNPKNYIKELKKSI